jgi:AcrR family transcriptional regulator
VPAVPTSPGAHFAPARGPGSTADGRRSRDRVLRAASELITEVGIDRVRLAEIARRAGMSSGQVMYYFTSKEHILLETLAWRERADTRRRRTSLTRVTGTWRQLERFIDLYLPASPADPSWILWMEAWARAPHSTEVSRFLDELMRPWRDDLTDILTRGAREGVFDPQGTASEVALRFCALLDGLAILRLRQMPSLTRKRLIEMAISAARAEFGPANKN